MQEINGSVRGGLWAVVEYVQTYKSAYGVWQRSDGRVPLMGYPFWDIQYMEQDKLRNRVGTAWGGSSQHQPGGIPRDKG